jgi:hypothetical protein
MRKRARAQAVQAEPHHSLEHCKNPWNEKCKNTEIELYIVYKGVQHPICGCCWNTLAEKTFEWTEPSSQALRGISNEMRNDYLEKTEGVGPAIVGINAIYDDPARPVLPCVKQAQSKHKQSEKNQKHFRPILNQKPALNNDPFRYSKKA